MLEDEVTSQKEQLELLKESLKSEQATRVALQVEVLQEHEHTALVSGTLVMVETEIKLLQDKLNAQLVQVDEATTMVRETEAKLSSMEEQMKTEQEKATQAKAELQEVHAKQKNLERQAASGREKDKAIQKRLKKELEFYKSQKDRVISDIRMMSNTIETLQTGVLNHAEKTATAKAEKMQAEGQVAELTDDLAIQIAKVTELTDLLDIANGERDQLKTQLLEKDQSAAENNNLLENLKTITVQHVSEIANIEAENRRLQTLVTEHTSVNTKIMEEHASQVAAVEAERDHLKSQTAEFTSLFAKLEAERDSLQTQVADYLTKIKKIQSEHVKHDKQMAENNTLLEKAQQESGVLKHEVTRQKARVAEATAALHSIQRHSKDILEK